MIIERHCLWHITTIFNLFVAADSMKQCLEESEYCEIIAAQILFGLYKSESPKIAQVSELDDSACSEPATTARCSASGAYEPPALTGCPESLAALAILKFIALIFISAFKPVSSIKTAPRDGIVTAEAGDERVIPYTITTVKIKL